MSADHQICYKNHLFCCAAQRQLIYLSAHIWGYIMLFWPIWYCLAIATYGTFIVSWLLSPQLLCLYVPSEVSILYLIHIVAVLMCTFWDPWVCACSLPSQPSRLFHTVYWLNCTKVPQTSLRTPYAYFCFYLLPLCFPFTSDLCIVKRCDRLISSTSSVFWTNEQCLKSSYTLYYTLYCTWCHIHHNSI